MTQNKFLQSVTSIATKTKEITMVPVNTVKAIKLAKRQLAQIDEAMMSVLDPDDLKALIETSHMLLDQLTSETNREETIERLEDTFEGIRIIASRIDKREQTKGEN